MSTTTVKAVWPGEKTEDLGTLRNSHGSAPVVWNLIAKKYLGLDDYEYCRATDKLWPTYKRADMDRHHRTVLLMTYDNAMVFRENYKQAASDIRSFLADFPAVPGYVNHWTSIADIFDAAPDCPAIGFHMTSVGEDPFRGEWNDDTEDYDSPDWSIYWNVYEIAAQFEGGAA